MKGLVLARTYYEAHIDQLLAAVPQAKGRIAAGLVGEGSQCFGFDDAFSQDHDFAPGFCLWLSDEDFDQFGAALQAAYDKLPSSFQGYTKDNIIAGDRLGVMPISEFYRRFTGSPTGVPGTNMDWLFTPEPQLAAATNGEVFCDDTGQFTEIRQRLSAFYPEDVRRKKIAARAAVMSQAGQYNLLRVIRRGDCVAALQALGRFTESTLSMIYLLNRRYMPFYKWAFHGLQIGVNDEWDLAARLCPLLERLSEIPGLLHQKQEQAAYDLAFHLTETICTVIAEELNHQGLSTVRSSFLQDHLGEIMAGIRDPQLKRLPPMLDCQN